MEAIDLQLALDRLRPHLTPKQRYIIDRLLAGETYCEIGLALGHPTRAAAKKAIYREVRRIKQQARRLGLRTAP